MNSAAADQDDPLEGSRYVSARAAAMGGAFLPLGEDGSSGLFYNPADIGKIRSTVVEPVNLSGDFNTGFTSTTSATGFYKMPSLSSYAPTLENNLGTNVGGGFQLFPNVYARGFAFGVLIASQLNGEATSSGTLRNRSAYYLIPTAGTSIRLADGIVRLGYSIQWVNEAVGDIQVSEAASPMGYNQGLQQGSGLSQNVGFALTLPYSYLPSLNLVARNLFGTHFNSSSIFPLAQNSSGAPSTDPMTFDASLSIQPKFTGGSYMNIVAEYRDFTNVSQTVYLERVALGLEYSYRDSFFVRGGWGQGYPDAGIGVRRKGSEFSLTWYSEEIGGGYQVQRDTRFMFQYQIRIY